MFGPTPVVRIVWPANAAYGGFVEINESDFDPKKHELFVEVARKGEPVKTESVPAKNEGGGEGGADKNGDGVTTAAELRFALDAKGIPYKKNDNKTVLQALLDDAAKE